MTSIQAHHSTDDVTLRTIPPAFEVDALARVLDGPLASARVLVRHFLDSPERHAYGLSVDEHRVVVRRWLHELRDTGVFDVAFPGVTSDVPDLETFFVVFETLAYGDLSLLVKVGVQLGLFGGSVLLLGTRRHRPWLSEIASLELEGCFAMSEVGHGSNVASLETVATYDRERQELDVHTPCESARKDWIGGAARDAHSATVFAQLEVDGVRRGVHAIVVPIRDALGRPSPGVTVGDCGVKMGLNGVDNGRLWFDHVRVPVGNLLDRYGGIDAEGHYQTPIDDPDARFFRMLGALVGGRVCVGSASVSVAKSALAIAVRYATERRQFGPEGEREVLLMEYPTHRRRLLPALATTYVLHFAFDRLRARYQEVMRTDGLGTPELRQFEAESAALKAFATWHATRTARKCREACGAQGYLAVNRLPQLIDDCEVFTTFEGDNTVLLQLVAKTLLVGLRERLGDRGWENTLRAASELVGVAVREKNPLRTRWTDPEHLTDREFHRQALAHREDVLLRSLARRIEHRHELGVAPHEAMLEVQEHLVAAALAFADRLAFEWFTEAVAAIEDEAVRARLDRLGDLHALSRITAKLSFYLEDGYIEPVKAGAIRDEQIALIDAIAEDARVLVDAFRIPDACLGAPIAFFDPAHPDLHT